MDSELIADLRALLADATPGPWVLSDTSDARGHKGELRAPSPDNGFMLVGPWVRSADIGLVARAREMAETLVRDAGLARIDPGPDEQEQYPHGSLVEQARRVIAVDQGVDAWTLAATIVSVVQQRTRDEMRAEPIEWVDLPAGTPRRCSNCRHAPHVNACLNMASDGGCSCPGGFVGEEIPGTRLVSAEASEPVKVAATDEPGQPRAFVLIRQSDPSGVSGTGVVAQGVEFADGTVALRWLSAWPTSVVFHDTGVQGVLNVHGHGGQTIIEWEESPNEAFERGFEAHRLHHGDTPTGAAIAVHRADSPEDGMSKVRTLMAERRGVPVDQATVRLLLNEMDTLRNRKHAVPSDWHDMPGVLLTSTEPLPDEEFVAHVRGLLDSNPQSPVNPVAVARLAEIAAARLSVLTDLISEQSGRAWVVSQRAWPQDHEFTVTPRHAREEIAVEIEALAANRDPAHPRRSARYSDWAMALADRIRHPERYSGVAAADADQGFELETMRGQWAGRDNG